VPFLLNSFNTKTITVDSTIGSTFPIEVSAFAGPNAGSTSAQAELDYELLPDLGAKSLNWHTNSADGGGIDATYTVTGTNLPPGATVAVYWASGTSVQDILSQPDKPGQPAYSAPADPKPGPHPFRVTASELGLPPAGATTLLLVADSTGQSVTTGDFSQFDEAGHVQSLAADTRAIESPFLNNGVPVVPVQVSVDPSNPATITATFKPAGGALTLDQAAAIAGVK
jgi:hypothetical protein